MQIPTAEQWVEPGDSYGRTGGRIMGPEGDRNSTGRPTKSTNLDPWELSETEPTTYLGWNEICGIYVADVQLSLHVGPPTTGVGSLPNAVV